MLESTSTVHRCICKQTYIVTVDGFILKQVIMVEGTQNGTVFIHSSLSKCQNRLMTVIHGQTGASVDHKRSTMRSIAGSAPYKAQIVTQEHRCYRTVKEHVLETNNNLIMMQ